MRSVRVQILEDTFGPMQCTRVPTLLNILEVKMPQKCLDEAIILCLLLGEAVAATFAATERVFTPRPLTLEEDELDLAVAMVIDEVDKIDPDSAQSLTLLVGMRHHKLASTDLPTLGDGLWNRLDPNVATQLLPLLQLFGVGAVDVVDLVRDSFLSVLLLLLL